MVCRRIRANRSGSKNNDNAMAQLPDFRAKDYAWLGFDMDHALVRYDVPELSRLIFNCIVKYIADRSEAGGFAELPYIRADELRLAEYDHAFAPKGAFLDLSTGDLLKLDDMGVVCAARHGKERDGWLSADELAARYGRGAWHMYGTVVRAERSELYFCFTTFFELAAAHLVALLVYLADVAAGGAPRGVAAGGDRRYHFMPAVLEAFNHIFLPEALALRRGGYFSTIVRHTARYVRRREEVGAWLAALRRAGVRTFLLTNSHVDYSELLMRHAFGHEWRSLFDLVVFHGGKGASPDPDLPPSTCCDSSSWCPSCLAGHGFFKGAGTVDHAGRAAPDHRPFHRAPEVAAEGGLGFLTQELNALGEEVPTRTPTHRARTSPLATPLHPVAGGGRRAARRRRLCAGQLQGAACIPGRWARHASSP